LVRQAILSYWARPDVRPKAGSLTHLILKVVEEILSHPPAYDGDWIPDFPSLCPELAAVTTQAEDTGR
jgi:hypothetical protein